MENTTLPRNGKIPTVLTEMDRPIVKQFTRLYSFMGMKSQFDFKNNECIITVKNKEGNDKYFGRIEKVVNKKSFTLLAPYDAYKSINGKGEMITLPAGTVLEVYTDPQFFECQYKGYTYLLKRHAVTHKAQILQDVDYILIGDNGKEYDLKTTLLIAALSHSTTIKTNSFISII